MTTLLTVVTTKKWFKLNKTRQTKDLKKIPSLTRQTQTWSIPWLGDRLLNWKIQIRMSYQIINQNIRVNRIIVWKYYFLSHIVLYYWQAINNDKYIKAEVESKLYKTIFFKDLDLKKQQFYKLSLIKERERERVSIKENTCLLFRRSRLDEKNLSNLNQPSTKEKKKYFQYKDPEENRIERDPIISLNIKIEFSTCVHHTCNRYHLDGKTY